MKLGFLPRLLRVQFTPVMIAPVTLGAAAAWHYAGAFSLPLFALVLAGSVSLHLAANGIDDVYDYVNGTDKITERIFPPDAPGWKPIARGMLSVADAYRVSYLFYGVSIAIGLFLSLVVGWYALAIAIPGILLSYFYTAPPLRLDYRGLGLGELSILFSFGPIPALGAYYVMARQVSAVPLLIAVPTGMLTVALLVCHDQIYFDVYREAGKKSLAVVLGKRGASLLSTALSGGAYVLFGALVLLGVLPPYSLLAVAALPFFFKMAHLGRNELPPPGYGSRTTFAFLDSTAFTLLLALGLLFG
jgi:1,4-dihydroxy-2-naphthoate polyprenyltransferase